MAVNAYPGSLPGSSDDARLIARMDNARLAMESEMGMVRERCQTYLRWYSPPYRKELGTHDAWDELPLAVEDLGLTRANFPIARAVVDIWASLEAAAPVMVRAEPQRLDPPTPSLDQDEEMRTRLVYGVAKKLEGYRANARSARLRTWMRRDQFALKHFTAVRRKDLYGFSWMKVWPDHLRRAPRSHVLRNPTTVYPIWSSRDPGDVEAVLIAYQMSAVKAAAKWPQAGLDVRNGRVDAGGDTGLYREVGQRWYDSTRTMVWVEEFWWLDQDYEDHRPTNSAANVVIRVNNHIVEQATHKGWMQLPFVYWENTDERDSYGWSDIASVIDINDEFNRRLSQEGDIIGMYSAPRFQLLNSLAGRDVEMPEAFELIPLQDQERIEQILTRIDVYPTQQHFTILTDLLHRVTGLPPIVWGLIANAQTSGRALTASWKATEARLAPKLMRNEQTLDRYRDIALNYAELYDWDGARRLFEDTDGLPFRDFRWEFPPMEPRDFQEVTMNAITKRDAGLQDTIMAMREVGDDAAEDTLEAVLAESLNIFLHPDKTQSFLLAQNAELQNQMLADQLKAAHPEGGPQNLATVAQAVGQGAAAAAQAQQQQAPQGVAGAPLPPTQAGGPVAGNAGINVPPGAPTGPGPGGAPMLEQPGTVTSGTLVRGGKVSNQFLQTGRLG
jgi:hypothetical protein